MISFNIPTLVGTEITYLKDVIKSKSFCGDKTFTRKCEEWLCDYLSVPHVLLTASCTQALEIAAILLDIGPEDEVILPSYTFVSTANAFALRGAKLKFVDINPQTMNIDIDCIEAAITPKTKLIVPVHYAGMSCDMEHLMSIANTRGIFVVEDAAQALSSMWNDKYLGTFGHLACFSFHETKNYHCGEGGALIINDKLFQKRAEILREKGTNRRQFFEGLIDKYTWVDLGTSGLMSELQAAFLLAQLENLEMITQYRLKLWYKYYELLNDKVPILKKHVLTQHNAHIFAIFTNSRSKMIQYLNDNGIQSSFHYLPLHASLAGKKYGEFIGEDKHTTLLSQTVLRLPLHMCLNFDDITIVAKKVIDYFNIVENETIR